MTDAVQEAGDVLWGLRPHLGVHRFRAVDGMGLPPGPPQTPIHCLSGCPGPRAAAPATRPFRHRSHQSAFEVPGPRLHCTVDCSLSSSDEGCCCSSSASCIPNSVASVRSSWYPPAQLATSPHRCGHSPSCAPSPFVSSIHLHGSLKPSVRSLCGPSEQLSCFRCPSGPLIPTHWNLQSPPAYLAARSSINLICCQLQDRNTQHDISLELLVSPLGARFLLWTRIVLPPTTDWDASFARVRVRYIRCCLAPISLQLSLYLRPASAIRLLGCLPL